MGRRDVNWTPDFMGFGNHLYLWAWAHAGRGVGPERRVLITPKMRYWAEVFPDARPLLIDHEEVRLLDKRGYYWADPLRHTGDRRGFTMSGREAFIRECLLPAPLFDVGSGSGPASQDVLTLSVRRGDFYSDPGHRPVHAIDLDAYLRRAVDGSFVTQGTPERVHVVSDDPHWCREHLAWLGDQARAVTYASTADSPADNFRDIATSRRLVISNSTFSMWGAFVSRTIHRDNAAEIWSPAFFMSTYGPGRCYEYDSDWSFIDSLPDGWQPDRILNP